MFHCYPYDAYAPAFRCTHRTRSRCGSFKSVSSVFFLQRRLYSFILNFAKFTYIYSQYHSFVEYRPVPALLPACLRRVTSVVLGPLGCRMLLHSLPFPSIPSPIPSRAGQYGHSRDTSDVITVKPQRNSLGRKHTYANFTKPIPISPNMPLLD